MDDIKQMAKTVAECIKGDTKKTKAYDTAAKVKRIENGTAYVEIPGGVSETPVKLTIDAKVGDNVQVHVGNGTAWLTGNQTAPPTDDAEALIAKAVAKVADKTANKAKTTAEQAETTANAVSGIANNALTQAQQAKQIADDTEQHFWFQETGADTGAHITEVTQEEWNDVSDPNYHSGGNLLARSNGIAVREGMAELASMSQNGFDAKSYDSNDDEVTIAHLGYGQGYDINGNLVDDPFYTLGARHFGSAVGNYSCAIGDEIIASGACSQAMGSDCSSSAGYAHAEGESSYASGSASHAENSSNASGSRAHSEGSGTASGDYSHAEGWQTTAGANYTHAGGEKTVAGYACQTAIGKYNNNKSGDIFEIGNGTAENARSNAFEVAKNGNATVQGDLTASNIGAKTWVTPSAVSCATGKWYKVAEVTLDPGLWFIDCNAAFPNTNATGTRQIRVTTATFTNGTTTAPASYGNITNDILVGANTAQYPQAHFPVDISSQTTFRLAAYQGSGSNMSVTGRMYATRIK